MSSLVLVSNVQGFAGESCGETAQKPETLAVAEPLSTLATVVTSVLQKAGEKEESKAITSPPAMTKELAPTVVKTAEKTAAVAASGTKLEEAPSREPMAEKLNGLAGITRSDSARTEIVEDNAPSSVEPAEKASSEPVLSKEEKEKIYVEKKKEEIIKKLNEWKKDLHPYPAWYLLPIPGIVELAKSDGAEMISKFEKKLDKTYKITGLKQVLEENVEIMASKLSKVNQETADKIKEGIAQAQQQIKALTPKKVARK
jgi:hypothetical protein